MFTPRVSLNLRPKGTNIAASSALPCETISVMASRGSPAALVGASMKRTTTFVSRFVRTRVVSNAASRPPAVIWLPPSVYRACILPRTSCSSAYVGGRGGKNAICDPSRSLEQQWQQNRHPTMELSRHPHPPGVTTETRPASALRRRMAPAGRRETPGGNLERNARPPPKRLRPAPARLCRTTVDASQPRRELQNGDASEAKMMRASRRFAP